MIHFTCDACCRQIDTNREVRYVARIEVYAALEEDDTSACEEHDHLQEIDELLDQLADSEEPMVEQHAYQQTRFDLCPECRERFLNNPVGKTDSVRLRFSQN